MNRPTEDHDGVHKPAERPGVPLDETAEERAQRLAERPDEQVEEERDKRKSKHRKTEDDGG